MIRSKRTIEEISIDVRRILNRELGVIETLRFFTQFQKGSGNFAEDRHQWQDGLSVKDIVAGIEEMREIEEAAKRQPQRPDSDAIQ